MYLTESEILDTPHALKNTLDYFEAQRNTIAQFFGEHKQRKFVFLGCGSSYMLAKGAAVLFDGLGDTTARAIPAGDYMLAPESWEEAVRGSIVVCLSRSGRTSEMVWAVRNMKETLDVPVICLSMEKGNDIAPMSQLNLTMDWCYDQSVCQTRTVTNLYAATLLLAGAYSGDAGLTESVRTATEDNASFMEAQLPVLREIAGLPWENVVVLADGPIGGIGEEGALAFTEIAMLPGRYFHLLDYRHGPIVISGEKTLTIALLRPDEEKLQFAMVKDLVAHGGIVVTVSQREAPKLGEAFHIRLPELDRFAALGIPFIYIAQMTAFLKSVNLGRNPDAPTGLDAYITL